ncbi:MAG: ExbD/TolR family protein [Sphingobium limneticum]
MASTSSFLSGKASVARPHYLSDINVTPFVDVMLVLLVIFMITAPMMATGLKVDLPQVRTDQLASDLEPVELSINAAGQVYLGEDAIASADLASTLQHLAAASGDPSVRRVFVGADRSVDYGVVMLVVSQVASAGFTRVAFLSDSRQHKAERVTP